MGGDWGRECIFKKFYSKHHAAERWDLEFGSNTAEKFENSLVSYQDEIFHSR